MINIDGKEYRNLQEQVKKNQEDIKLLKFGLNIKGRVNTVPELPSNAEIGETYMVGLTAPYYFYIKSADKTWDNLGKLESDIPGPKGNTGDAGEEGIGILDMNISEEGMLEVIYTNGDTKTIGKVVGDTGPMGLRGFTGKPAAITEAIATVDNKVGTPSVVVTTGGTDDNRSFGFEFHNLKGEKGETGASGIGDAKLYNERGASDKGGYTQKYLNPIVDKGVKREPYKGEGVDLNTYLKTGIFVIANATHGPLDVSAGVLIVLPYADRTDGLPNKTTQILFYPHSDDIYLRSSDYPTWDEWIKLPKRSEITEAQSNITTITKKLPKLFNFSALQFGSDANTLVEQGVYTISQCKNCPQADGSLGLGYGTIMSFPYSVKTPGDPNKCHQLYLPLAGHGNDVLWYRTSDYQAGSWNEWKPVGAGGGVVDLNVWLSGDLTYGINVDTKLAEYNALINDSGNTDSFIFSTDQHYFPNTSHNVKKEMIELQKYYNTGLFNFAMFGGDWTHQYPTKFGGKNKLVEINGMIKTLFKNYLSIVGNHDSNYQSDGGRGEMLSNNMISNAFYSGAHKLYFKYNSPKTKYYVFDSGIESFFVMDDYRWEQVEWFANEIKKDDAKYSAIAVHAWLSKNRDIEGHPHQRTAMSEQLALIIAAYNNRRTITIHNKTYDYTQCKGKLKFIVAGHTHIDLHDVVDNSVPVMITTCVYLDSSFDMAYVDYDNERVDLIRVGPVGTNRAFSMTTGEQLA